MQLFCQTANFADSNIPAKITKTRRLPPLRARRTAKDKEKSPPSFRKRALVSYADHSSEIAPTGQLSAQAPQLTQASASIQY